MMSIGTFVMRGATALFLAGAVLSAPKFAAVAQASEIKYVVNNVPVTTYDIQRRAAFHKLQGKKKGGKSAQDEMIEQALKEAEIKKLGIRISEKQVNDAFAKFAGSNKMSVKQMSSILGQAGVTADHFKKFMQVQMGWNQALSARFRSNGNSLMSEQEAVRKMLQQGGTKPSATEYMLQQVIFVVPASERKSGLAKRRKEAEAMRQRFTGCEATKTFAKGLVDVTVRDLGRILAPELPPDWAESVKATKPGQATKVRETDRGLEFVGICSTREVSDDRVAQMVFSTEAGGDNQAEELGNKYIAELREKARIVER